MIDCFGAGKYFGVQHSRIKCFRLAFCKFYINVFAVLVLVLTPGIGFKI